MVLRTCLSSSGVEGRVHVSGDGFDLVQVSDVSWYPGHSEVGVGRLNLDTFQYGAVRCRLRQAVHLYRAMGIDYLVYDGVYAKVQKCGC